MRTQLLDYIQTLDLGGFNASQELPWEESGLELYIKNLKKIYVDADQFTVEPVITALDGLSIYNEVTIVRVFFANDAKQIPPNYSELVSQLRSGKDIEAAQGFRRRECTVDTSVQADRLVTELEFRFTKITR